MQGKVVVVTGSNIGIGKETAVGLASRGATTILACRDAKRAEAAREEVQRRAGHDDVHVVSLDLADLNSVRACARRIQETWGRVDVLVNNAGGVWTERLSTAQGFEQTFAVNHLGHFYLTNLLLDCLAAASPARVINLSSVGHHFAVWGMRWDDLNWDRMYTPMEAYFQSKLANILFTRGLARRVDRTQMTSNAVHPGMVRSRFGMDGDMNGMLGVGLRLIRPFEISPAAGAKTSIFLASDSSVEGKSGGYWVRSRLGHPSRAASDQASAERLWDESERLLASAGFALPARG